MSIWTFVLNLSDLNIHTTIKKNYIKIMPSSTPHQNSVFIIYLLEDEQELSLGMLIRLRRIYIFYCSMPILYNFHILLATLYTIFGTNILIQCPVPVPVCCMFFVSQNIHIKRRPDGIKTDGDFFGIYVIFGKKIHARRCPRGPWGRVY